jgi:crotonobetainyl-CoA:carnitine CoA-transferase CaiB-like acyl-CoA transferase
VVGEEPPGAATRAPDAGEHGEAILAEVLGYDTSRIAALRAAGALGPRKPL